MKALLIVAHGCRIEAANDEVFRLAKSIQQNAEPKLDRVAGAFLEIASPQVEVAIANLIGEGATEIAVFPYFLVEGTHVAKDIPRIIKAASEKYPDVGFEISPHLGRLQGIDNLILDHIYDSPPPATD